MTKTLPALSISNLSASVGSLSIINKLNLEVGQGQTHAIVGQNGSGKSTLAAVLMGSPLYEVTEGTITLYGEQIQELSVSERARNGLFLAFQYPFEVEGVPLRDFLRQAYNALYQGTEKQIGVKAFRELLEEKAQLLSLPSSLIDRPINVGCSGGEKKRLEMFQIAVLQPRFVILDEIDSGLDVDALKSVCAALSHIKAATPDMSIVIITHYQRLLDYLSVDAVHVMDKGNIACSGNSGILGRLEEVGYKGVLSL